MLSKSSKRFLILFFTYFFTYLEALEFKAKDSKNSIDFKDFVLLGDIDSSSKVNKIELNRLNYTSNDSINPTDSTKPTNAISFFKNQDSTKTSFLDSTKESIKNHFDKINEHRETLETQDSLYKYYMTLMEHEGTFFTYQYSLPPYGIYDSDVNIPSELKFQLSFKFPIWQKTLWTRGSIFFAYTQTMWFQQFNYRYSNPVRDTNYKPYMFYSYPANWSLFGGKIKELRVGMIHYSNGVGGDECQRLMNNNAGNVTINITNNSNCRSRSAGTRPIAEIIWEIERKGHIFGLQLSAWPYVPGRRDNADLIYYMGYADAKLYYRQRLHLVELQIAPIISNYARYHGSFRLSYSFAVNNYISLYAQYFYGYGDSLYEYNILSSRLGFGIRATSF